MPLVLYPSMYKSQRKLSVFQHFMALFTPIWLLNCMMSMPELLALPNQLMPTLPASEDVTS